MNTITKDQLIARGWTVEILRERLTGCRNNMREFKNLERKPVYRRMNADFYLAYKKNLFTLLS